MQLTFDQSTSTVWIFATPNELLQMAAMAQQRVTEAQLGESLIIFEGNVNRSGIALKISSSKDSEKNIK